MQALQQNFINLCLSNHILRFGEFTLKSGRISPYFFNAGLFNTGASLAALGKYYAETIMAADLEFDVLFGPAYKGVPLACTTAIALAAHHQKVVGYAFNRKEAKAYAEGGSLVGYPLEGQKVLIIDDVISAGTAVRESITTLKNANAIPVGVLIAMDRQERGQTALSAVREVEKTYQIPVLSIINLADLMLFVANNADFNSHAQALAAYKKTYGMLDD